MFHIITVGKRLVPIEDIAIVEAFEARDDPSLRSSKEFRARVVLVDRESLLIEQTQEAFAKAILMLQKTNQSSPMRETGPGGSNVTSPALQGMNLSLAALAYKRPAGRR
ncbi:hypothetical protein ACVWZ4_003833 [Bradyrhizobium sp. USDA 4472]